MSVYVYLGPTLPVEEARRHLDAIYLPPIEQGDLLRLMREKPYAVGIVDGRFQFVPSVWHKEILTALAQGVHVFGAASMGALRAAELAEFGMIGIGAVYEKYRSGELEDDDEVAVAHATAEHGFLESSDAMVNIRDTCEAAANEGVLSAPDAARIVEIAKDLFYPERHWARIFEVARAAGIDTAAIDSFRRQRIPAKRRDAIALLDRMATFCVQPRSPFRPRFTLERTIFLDNLQIEAETVAPGFDDASHAVARKKVLLELLALQEARRLGLLIEPQDLSDMAAWFGLEAAADPEVLTRFVALAKVQEHYRGAIERALPAHLAIVSAGSRPSDWSQWNIALSRTTAPAAHNARELFALLEPELQHLRDAGALTQFFFMRKAPDIRLRFRGDPAALTGPLTRIFETARDCGHIERFFPSIYEPETRRFGGPAAMELVHAYFDAGTRAWLAWPAAPPEYAVAVLQHLFQQTLQSAPEAAQVWDLLAEGAPEVEAAGGVWTGEFTADDLHANLALAEGLQRLWHSGALQAGLRSLLAAVAMFHFNRYGIAGPQQAALAKGMALAYA